MSTSPFLRALAPGLNRDARAGVVRALDLERRVGLAVGAQAHGLVSALQGRKWDRVIGHEHTSSHLLTFLPPRNVAQNTEGSEGYPDLP